MEMAACVNLETQISSVMESLTRAAVQEICKLIDTECVEMRLEIRRGQNEIESLKRKLQDLKRELKQPPSTPLSLMDRHGDQHERAEAHQEPECQTGEEDNEMSGLTEDLQQNGSQEGQNSSSSLWSEQNQASLFSEKDILFRESQILGETSTTEDKPPVRGLSTVALKLEGQPVSTAGCEFEICEAGQKQCTNTPSCRTGDNTNGFDATEEFQLPPHYHDKHLSEDVPHYNYEMPIHHQNGDRSNGENPCGVNFKTEEEEEPLTKSISGPDSCAVIDGDALPWPCLNSQNFETGEEGPGCSSMVQQTVHLSHTEPHGFNLNEMLPSQSVTYTVEPESKQDWGRKGRIPIAPLRQNSASLSVMLANTKALPRADTRHKLFACSFCPKSFQSTTDLKRHQRIHTGEKPFGCAVCGKRFSLRGNLVTHERGHSGSKPFICRQCGRAFAHGSNLRAHQRVHTGEKPFHCSFCGMTFAWYYPFKRHLGMHCVNSTNS